MTEINTPEELLDFMSNNINYEKMEEYIIMMIQILILNGMSNIY